MTKEEFASRLHNREYGAEITAEDQKLACENDLVAIFGYSDDNTELRGAIDDEIPCYRGGVMLLHRTAVLPPHDDCECEFCGYQRKAKQCAQVAINVNDPDYTFTYTTNLPHAPFEILEGTNKYCRGIVISVADLPILT